MLTTDGSAETFKHFSNLFTVAVHDTHINTCYGLGSDIAHENTTADILVENH